jgi:glucoamylase
VTGPRRSAVLVDVRLESLTGRPYKLYALLDPARSPTPATTTSARPPGGARWSRATRRIASALRTKPAPTRVSSGYAGASDGWTDLESDFRMDWSYARAPARGNVAQIAELPLTGKRSHRHATLTLGFGATGAAATRTAGSALAGGFARAARRYAAGWHA